MRVRLFLSVLSIWLATISLWAQHSPLLPYEFHHIQQQDGLSFNFINCLFKDRDGFLWIGTNTGLNRFDGSHFMIFKNDPANSHSLGNNTVHAVCQDKAGHVWVATDTGINEFDPQTGYFRPVHSINGRPLGTCLNILCDRSGTIWFSSYNLGLFRYNPLTRAVKLYAHSAQNPRSLSENYIAKNGLLEDPSQNGIWIATRRNGGLNYLDLQSETFQNYRNNPDKLPIYTANFVSALAVDGHHLLFADNNANQIVVFDLVSRQIIKTIAPVSQTGRETFELQTIFVDRQHNLWVSGWTNVTFFIEANTYRVKEIMHDDNRRTSIANSSFWTAYQQPDGTIWLGTINGISYTNPSHALYEVYELKKLFPHLKEGNGIYCFSEDTDASWWLGTRQHGLLHYDPATNRLETYRIPYATTQFPYGILIRNMFAYGSELIMASFTHLLRFNKLTKQFKTIPLPAYFSTNQIEPTCIQLQGDRLWVFGYGKQAFCYDLSTGQWHQYPVEAAPTNSWFWVSHPLVDRENNLWLDLHPAGFARFSPETGRFTLEKETNKPSYESTLASLIEDKNGYFWMTTGKHGLARYDPRNRRYRLWTESDGLAYNHCLAALPDRFGNIWVGAYNTFSVFTPARNRFLNFTLPYSEDNLDYYNYLWPLRNGHILATLKGYLIEFKPEVLPHITVQRGTVLLSGLVTGDSTYLLGGPTPSVQLKPSDNSFSVHYSVLGPLHEKQYQYRYKLEGYDNEWSKAGPQTTAWYNKLPGGDYVFAVKAVSINSQETPVRRLAIHIDTVFYQTAAFRALLLLTLLGIGIGVIRYRIKQTSRMHHLQVQATRLERDKTEIQYQNLINHLNPHFLFNSLTSLNSLIIIDPKQASGFLQKLSAIYRYILQNKEKETISLTSELAFVQQYIDLQQAQLEDGLQITIDIPADNLAYEIVPVTLQNLLENAIKHNITDDDSPLRIRVFVMDNYLCVANNLQKKPLVRTSNKQGLDSLQKLYTYLSDRPLLIEETGDTFIVKVPLL